MNYIKKNLDRLFLSIYVIGTVAGGVSLFVDCKNLVHGNALEMIKSIEGISFLMMMLGLGYYLVSIVLSSMCLSGIRNEVLSSIEVDVIPFIKVTLLENASLFSKEDIKTHCLSILNEKIFKHESIKNTRVDVEVGERKDSSRVIFINIIVQFEGGCENIYIKREYVLMNYNGKSYIEEVKKENEEQKRPPVGLSFR